MRLTKIYTRTGDQGTTRLANGAQVSKDALGVEAYGDVDELNSIIGSIIAQQPSQTVADLLQNVQHHLFDMGGELASAGTIENLITPEMVQELEKQIDTFNADLPALEEFILPGGTVQGANLHIARTVCRRAERRIVTLSQSESVSEHILSYINRLSDLLFVLARHENHVQGNAEILWKNPRR